MVSNDALVQATVPTRGPRARAPPAGHRTKNRALKNRALLLSAEYRYVSYATAAVAVVEAHRWYILVVEWHIER